MKRSDSRILTTHTGSLPRPPDLVALLNKKELGEPYKAGVVRAEHEKREAIKQYSNWPTIPQLYVGGKFIGGSDILRELNARGEFAGLVK